MTINAIFPGKVDIEPSIEAKFKEFDQRLMGQGKPLTHEQLLSKMNKQKYQGHMQALAQTLTDLSFDAVRLLKEMNDENQIHEFVAGMINNSNHYSNQIKTIQSVIKILKSTQTKCSLESKEFFSNELELLEFQKELEMTLAEEKQKHSVKQLFDSTLYFESLRDAPETYSLTWNHLVSLLNKNLSIRHVSSREAAEQCVLNGCIGDALALSGGIPNIILYLSEQGNIPNLNIPQEVKDDQKNDYIYSNFDKICAGLTEADKSLIAQTFEDSLYRFIYGSTLTYDNPINLEEEKSDWMSKRQRSLSNSHFLIYQQDEFKLPYDYESYFQLGKLGKHCMEGKRFKEVIWPNIPFAYENDESLFMANLCHMDQNAVLSVYEQTLNTLNSI